MLAAKSSRSISSKLIGIKHTGMKMRETPASISRQNFLSNNPEATLCGVIANSYKELNQVLKHGTPLHAYKQIGPSKFKVLFYA